MKNGELLSMAEQAGFQVFVTIDQGLAYQQNLSSRSIAIVVLQSKSNRLVDLVELLPNCFAAMEHIKPGQLQIILG